MVSESAGGRVIAHIVSYLIFGFAVDGSSPDFEQFVTIKIAEKATIPKRIKLIPLILLFFVFIMADFG
jgi:hypothetical protein